MYSDNDSYHSESEFYYPDEENCCIFIKSDLYDIICFPGRDV